MILYDRKKEEYINRNENGDKSLAFLYNTIIGRLFLKFIVRPFVSKLYGLYNNSILSKNKIDKFISKNNINVQRYEDKEYQSFNDFFTRRLRFDIVDMDNKNFVSPCDGKLLVYDINDNLKVNIKGFNYSISDLIADDNISDFNFTKCLVFRLALDDYHRYCFVDNCYMISQRKIKGVLHTVRSISDQYKVFKINKRVCSLLKTDNFGKVYQIEVGALFVGDIRNVEGHKFEKGMEKGYFNLGGSTIILLVDDKVEIDYDILKQSKKGIETVVKYGEKIGIKSFE